MTPQNSYYVEYELLPKSFQFHWRREQKKNLQLIKNYYKFPPSAPSWGNGRLIIVDKCKMIKNKDGNNIKLEEQLLGPNSQQIFEEIPTDPADHEDSNEDIFDMDIRQGPPQRRSGGVLGVDEPLRGSSSSTAQNTPLQVFFPRTAPLPAALASPQHSSQVTVACQYAKTSSSGKLKHDHGSNGRPSMTLHFMYTLELMGLNLGFGGKVNVETSSVFSKLMAEYWSNCMRSASQNLEEH
ncbi:hypothetical protein Taro_005204 [Colocasia esculenta]|uniref:Uncharacterized protein n=1 Tax=Colocasia esculenta TaxID=4460 RepID=A0A843TKC7_COLES|nr:hypothetical protein [Colocasia esculenta]